MPEDDGPGPAELEAAGLYDPEAEDAPQHLALLEYLVGLGATIDDLVTAKPGELPVLASTIALWGDRERLTLDEVAEASRVGPALIARTWRAAGFPEPDPAPDVRAFLRRDVEILTLLRGGIEFFGEEVTIQMMRVLGAVAARVADASVTAFFVNIMPQALEQDPSGLELARANAESMVLLDGMTRGFDTLLRHHIERGFRPIEMMSAAAGIDLVRRSVGFADLVDSTAWTQQLDLPALSQALSMFDSTASEIVVGRGGRVVKLIGDSVMFVANDPITATDIALALVDAFAAHEVLPPVRAGIATGDVLARDGDYSGVVVNLAARAVNVARPSTVLVDPETYAALDGSTAFSCDTAGAFALKGFAERVRLARVERLLT
ncbi:MAG: adenylate/guanylate cyclase domain-containing protein [Actinomycetota bacterium]|nr:adenylate/guanylate cyclase domain-containing protein [Actinomycetota bacterium]